jgi:hypothetical protein
MFVAGGRLTDLAVIAAREQALGLEVRLVSVSFDDLLGASPKDVGAQRPELGAVAPHEGLGLIARAPQQFGIALQFLCLVAFFAFGQPVTLIGVD